MANFRPPLNSGSMAIGSMSCQGQRHGVGTEGERGTERPGGTEGTDRQDMEQARNGKRGVVQVRGGQRGAEKKNQPLVGNVKEYREFYGGGSAD